jgi:hypothetical protein
MVDGMLITVTLSESELCSIMLQLHETFPRNRDMKKPRRNNQSVNCLVSVPKTQVLASSYFTAT